MACVVALALALLATQLAAQLVPQTNGEASSRPGTGNQVGTPLALVQMLQAFEGQKVTSVELAGLPGLDDHALLPLFVQHAGEPFDGEKVKQTVAAIRSAGKATGTFEDVQLSVLPDVEGVRILLILQPGLYFGIYEFPGSKSLAYSRLLQAANYPPEGPYNDRDVKQAAESLTKFLEQSGYFLAKVAPKIEADATHGIVNVRFEIELGRKARFGTVTLTGATEAQTALLQARLKSVMARLRSAAIRTGKVYTFKTIQNATQYMQNALAKQDLLGAKVQLIGAEYDPATNRANISFHVAPGPRVRVELTGGHVWKVTQRRLLPVYQRVGFDDELVEEGRRNLVSYFEGKGYFDAVVETNISEQGNGNKTIAYKIGKGPKHKVSSVSIDGNKVLGDKQLLARVSVRKKAWFSRGAYSEKLLRASTKSLEATYRAEGFSEVKVTPKVAGKGGDLDVTFVVQEGARDTVRELSLVGNDTMTAAQLVPKGLKLKPGQPYSQKMADEDRQAITVKYLESGYLTATFRETVKVTPDDKHSLIVSYEIYEGPKVTTASIVTLGRGHTRQRFIDRAAKFKLGAPLTTGDMLSAESRLYSPGIFDWAEVTPRRAITTQTEEEVLVKVHEARRSTLTYGVGFEVIRRGGNLPTGTVALPGLPPLGINSNFATSEKTFWGPRGSVEYTRRNILGLAESLTIGSLAGRLTQRVSANFQNPSLWGTSWASDVNASFSHDSSNPIYTDRIALGGFQVQRAVNHNKTEHVYFRYSYSDTEITNLLIPELVPSSDLDVKLSTVAATFSRDTRDKPLDASRGMYESVETDFNPQALGSSVSFVRLLAQVANYQKLPRKIIWANSIRVGFDSAFAGSHVPLSQLFFSGGGSTIRGFPLNGAGPQRIVQACGIPGNEATCTNITVPEGGRQLFIFNSEFRIPTPFYKGVGVAAFYDGGNVFEAIGFHGQYKNTVGGGLRYATPVGPVRFDIGYNVNAPRGLSAIQYFVTLGQAF
jgi:outer membrane protein assembly factor BamA